MKLIHIILILLIIVLIFLCYQTKQPFFNPCTDPLTDTEFLEHMIPHHQVAVDMSVLLQPISKNPIMQELKPAINCAGTISTVGNFLTIIIKTANVIGIVKAARFPVNSPGVNEFPTITKTPVIAKIIEIKVIVLIFSFKKK